MQFRLDEGNPPKLGKVEEKIWKAYYPLSISFASVQNDLKDFIDESLGLKSLYDNMDHWMMGMLAEGKENELHQRIVRLFGKAPPDQKDADWIEEYNKKPKLFALRHDGKFQRLGKSPLTRDDVKKRLTRDAKQHDGARRFLRARDAPIPIFIASDDKFDAFVGHLIRVSQIEKSYLCCRTPVASKIGLRDVLTTFIPVYPGLELNREGKAKLIDVVQGLESRTDTLVELCQNAIDSYSSNSKKQHDHSIFLKVTVQDIKNTLKRIRKYLERRIRQLSQIMHAFNQFVTDMRRLSSPTDDEGRAIQDIKKTFEDKVHHSAGIFQEFPALSSLDSRSRRQ